MSDYIKLRKGLDVPVKGSAQPLVKGSIVSEIIAVKPTDFKGLIPRLAVKEGDLVKAGSPVFFDKKCPEIRFTSPVSGTVKEIVRGDKRKLLEIRIQADSTTDYIKFNVQKPSAMSAEEIKNVLLESGLWPCLKQRPYGIIPRPTETPRDIFVSGFDSAPLAADLDFALKDEFANIQTAVNVLAKLTTGRVHLGLYAATYASSVFHKLENVEIHKFDGPHPAGNVGIQIHHVAPVNKGEIVWTVNMHHLAAIGKLFNHGIYDMTRLVAVTGPRVNNPAYVKGISGMCMKDLAEFRAADSLKMHADQNIRYISGNILTGTNVGENGFLGFFDNQVTFLSEGNYYETFGWAKIFRPKKFSFSRSYFSWLCPKKKYEMDTNVNGGERAFVLSSVYDKVLPMDILSVYLFKAILAEDIEKMEQLGIYEIIEEDVALCEYVCPSKIGIQAIVSKGIDLMIKEMA